MKLSPQSNAIVVRLLGGQSAVKGKTTVGPLNETAQLLLKLLVEHFDELSRLKGEDRASKLRERFIAAQKQPAAAAPASTTQAAPLIPCPVSPGWKIVRLRCQSIRGIAPPGEVFEFDFHQASTLLYGPNGSGKTSLLGAVIWVLTGETIIDATTSQAEAPLYKPTDGSAAGAKLRDWPVVATLPSESDVTKAKTDCWAELSLNRPSDNTAIRLRRQYGTQLQASLDDGTTWTTVSDLSQIAIQPLDLQLSVIAPTIFGRRSIEEAEHTRNILGLMLGFDDLEQLGELASQISGNRTRLANAEKTAIETKVRALQETLRLLSAQLPEASESATAVAQLAALATLSVAQIEATAKKLGEAADTAEKQLAEVIGLSLENGKPAGNLADRLTVAVDRLGQEVAVIFALLNAIDVAVALPPQEDKESIARLSELESNLQHSATEIRTSIARRYEWWKQETAPGSKAGLLLKAAQHFDATVGDCPVCERRIDDSNLTDKLSELKALDSHLGTELRTFFSDLVTAHRRIIPKSIADLSAHGPKERLLNDWGNIRDTLLGDSFATITATVDTKVTEIAATIPESGSTLPSLLPAECDPAFRTFAEPLVTAMTASEHSISILRWSVTGLTPLHTALQEHINGTGENTLLTQLTKGKESAQLVKPLVAVGRELAKAKQTQQAIDTSRALLTALETLETPINQLKLLSKYAETAVREEFEAIKDTTTTNLGLMYPETPTGMRPGKLKLGKGKDKTVEALLAGTAFEVPGQYFANASLQRAIALAFYFALLQKHPGGLGFIAMDDPILSLDEEHRERWSAHILRPMLATLQIIVATHQRQFLRNCSNDFAADRIVDLNPRDRHRRISWKPGDRLRRAHQQLNDHGDHLSAATTMRKFREDLLISLDSYSPTPFFDPGDLSKSATAYEQLPSHHPLFGESQKKISEQLKSQEVRRVLDPGSHSMTEADVTAAMAQDCYKKLDLIGHRAATELQRLDRLRERSLRANVIEATVIPFPPLDASVSWQEPVELPLVGAAAAKSNPWSVEFNEKGKISTFAPGGAVQVCGDSLEPVAHAGHWMLLAKEGEDIRDGELVAARDEHGANFLRRVWSDGRSWILQSINPIRPTATVTVLKRLAGIRKVIGVLYKPLGTAAPKAGRFAEWLPSTSLNAAKAFEGCKTIDVQGDSLNPVARDGQKVLVDEPLPKLSDCPEGALAVLEFVDDSEGCVVKQVFPDKDQWVLVSPNSIECLRPMIVSSKDIRAVWLVRGVLFETVES